MKGATMTDFPDPRQDPTLSVEDAAELLRISRASAYQGVKAGEIPSIRVGRRILVPTAALLTMLGVPAA